MGFIDGSIASAGDPQALPPQDSPSGDNPRVMPMQSIMQSIMRGNAETQAQAQVKDVAGKQANATKQLSVTMTANPDDPGNPLLHIKNATADIINQTQRSDLQKTYDTPHRNVEDAIAKMNAPRQPPGDFENTALASAGYQPYRTDRTAADLQTFSQDYRAQRELGEPVMKAAIKAGLMKLGAFDRDRVATALDRESFAKNSAAYKEIAPAIREEDYQSRSNRSEATLANTMAHQNDVENRLLQTQSDNEKKAVYARHNAINKGIDYSQIDPGPNNVNWHRAFDDQNDTGVAATPQQYAAIDRKGAIDVGNSLAAFRKDKAALGIFPDFDSARASFPHDIPPGQLSGFRADWQAARNDYNIKQQNEVLKIKAAANQAQRLQITLDRQPDHPTAGAAYDQQLDKLIAAENSGADLTKMGVDTKTHGDMVQRRLGRMASGDQEARFPVALSAAGATAMSKLSGLRTETQSLMGTLNTYLSTPEGKKYANVPFSELPAAAKYKMGMASEDDIAKLQSAFSIERYAGTLQLIPGIRRGDIIQKASEHLPIFGKDSIQLMRDKLANADKFYANNQAGLQKYSTKTGVSNIGATAAPGGPVVTDPNAIMNIFKKKP